METRVSSLLPEQFGPLQGVRVLSTGSLIAQPYAATLAAEMGAEVIQVERPGEGDAAWRHLGRQLPTKDGKGKIATTWIQERRNEFYVSLDMSKPEGKDLFLRLVKSCDVWMESSKPGSYSKWGLTDDAVLQANP
jgi:crotonobetainyl-CoA:carnitine CoA-transferase CaiB-like acyl-CoA transferase